MYCAREGAGVCSAWQLDAIAAALVIAVTADAMQSAREVGSPAWLQLGALPRFRIEQALRKATAGSLKQATRVQARIRHATRAQPESFTLARAQRPLQD